MTDTPPAAPPPPPQEAAEPAPATLVQRLGWPGMLAAAVLIGFFLVLTWTMFFDRLELQDIHWSRAMQIYSGIEAFALAAAGALLGTQIQARNVAAAERRADNKDKEATRAKEQAAKSNSELGGYRRTVAAARQQVEMMESSSERGGGDAGGKARDLAVLRGILIPVES